MKVTSCQKSIHFFLPRSDSKGASAAISTEAAIMSVHRCKFPHRQYYRIVNFTNICCPFKLFITAMKGFKGPKDIFRNPEAPFRIVSPITKNK